MKRTATVFTLLLLAATAASATQIIYKSPRDLGREATLVVDGRVAGVRSYWNAEHTAIFTETLVDVSTTYKGDDTGTVRVVQPGGIVGHVRTTVAGALSWNVGEDVVLFLEPAAPGAYRVSGFSQGKFTVERDPATGAQYVRAADTGGAQVFGAPSADGSTQLKRVSVETFVNQALGRK
jgi:hypothetical protein